MHPSMPSIHSSTRSSIHPSATLFINQLLLSAMEEVTPWTSQRTPLHLTAVVCFRPIHIVEVVDEAKLREGDLKLLHFNETAVVGVHGSEEELEAARHSIAQRTSDGCGVRVAFEDLVEHALDVSTKPSQGREDVFKRLQVDLEENLPHTQEEGEKEKRKGSATGGFVIS